jgi:hypothetical protein
MSGYKCISCNYNTDRYSNYKNHLLTKKHIRLTKNINTQTSVQTSPKWKENGGRMEGIWKENGGGMEDSNINNSTQAYNNKDNSINNSNCDNNINIVNNDNINTINNNNNNNNNNDLDIFDKKVIQKKMLDMDVILSRKYNSDIYTCKFCNSIYKHKNSLRDHLKSSCIYIPEKYKSKLIAKHNSNGNTKNKLTLTSSGIVALHNNNTNNINSNNTNNTNNIQNNFNINVLGKESISHIPEERIIAILSSGNNVMKEYLTDVYKDNDNVNALINIRTKSIMFINENNELESGEMSDVLGTMADAHFDNICKMYKTHKSKCKPIAQKTFEEVYGGFYNQDYGIEEDEEYIDTSEYNNYDTNIPSILERQVMFKLIDVKYISKDKLGKFKKFKINNTENIMIGIL